MCTYCLLLKLLAISGREIIWQYHRSKWREGKHQEGKTLLVSATPESCIKLSSAFNCAPFAFQSSSGLGCQSGNKSIWASMVRGRVTVLLHPSTAYFLLSVPWWWFDSLTHCRPCMQSTVCTPLSLELSSTKSDYSFHNRTTAFSVVCF